MDTTTATASVPVGGAAEAPSAGLARGMRLGGYELVLPIASGGMGRVWVAIRHGEFGFQRAFALKVMREEFAEHPTFRRMFLDEAKIASRIRHSNVVEVIDLGEALGTVFQVMPLVDGDSLAHLLEAFRSSSVHDVSDKRAVAPAIAVRIVSDALRGLHAAHELLAEDGRPLGLVHRDVSPQNILVGLDGVAKVADFGIARAADTIANDGHIEGKLAYMAPEQLLGEPLDRRSDVFAAGVILWELLTGVRSRQFGKGALAGEDVPDPRSLRGDAPPLLGEVAMRALAAHPADRFPTAEAMADALENAARASGISPSLPVVASWVSALARERVSRLRQEVTRVLRTASDGHAQLASREESVREVGLGIGTRRSSPSRRYALLIGAACIAASVTGAITVQSRTRGRAGESTETQATNGSSLGATSASPPGTELSLGKAAADGPSAPMPAAPSASAAPAVPRPGPTRRPRSETRPRGPASPGATVLPKYENPYAR
jgi:eukaryotic-like serine/threonine-protein kinase